MSVAENIKRIRSHFNVTQKELADVAGVTENAVSKWENGYAAPRMGAIERIAACYGLTKSNIIEDDGMACVYRKEDFLPKGAIYPTIPQKRAYAPLLGSVHAGTASEPTILEDSIHLPYEVWRYHKNGYFLEVEGDCMSRVYPEGCYVFIDPDMQPHNGSIAVIVIDYEDYVMRRFYMGANTLILSPDSFNSEHEDIVFTDPEAHDIQCKGVVVWYQPKKELD